MANDLIAFRDSISTTICKLPHELVLAASLALCLMQAPSASLYTGLGPLPTDLSRQKIHSGHSHSWVSARQGQGRCFGCVGELRGQ